MFEGYPSELMIDTMKIARWLLKFKIRERTGVNDHPMIEHFLSRVNRGPGLAWCAAVVSALIEFASDAQGRDYPPIKTSGLVYDIWQDAVRSRSFIPKGDIEDSTEIPDGTIFIIQYGDTHRGHTGFVEQRPGLPSHPQYGTIEGNFENKYDRNVRSMKDGNLKGFIPYP